MTDANLAARLLPDGGRLGGAWCCAVTFPSGPSAGSASRLGLDARRSALGVVRVADTEMVRALRLISVQRGLDPRDFALVAFGGAGGLHACALAEELGCRTVLVPRAAGVLSALGLAISEVRHDFLRPALGRRPLGGRSADLESAFTALESAARPDLDDAGRRSGWPTCGTPGSRSS